MELHSTFNEQVSQQEGILNQKFSSTIRAFKKAKKHESLDISNNFVKKYYNSTTKHKSKDIKEQDTSSKYYYQKRNSLTIKGKGLLILRHDFDTLSMNYFYYLRSLNITPMIGS